MIFSTYIDKVLGHLKMNPFAELIQKYQALNDFTLSQENMDLYKSIREKLESLTSVERKEHDYSYRFNMKSIVISIKPSDDIIVVANTKGCVCYANPNFYAYSGVDEKTIELNPGSFSINTLRHPDMPKSIFEDLWNTINDGKIWSGIICNRNLRNQDYWQIVNIFPIFDNGEIVNYIAFNKKAPESVISEVVNIYRKIS